MNDEIRLSECLSLSCTRDGVSLHEPVVMSPPNANGVSYGFGQPYSSKAATEIMLFEILKELRAMREERK